MTYEVLLDRMLKAVLQDNENLDTREGSVIYNALAPAAVELQNMYIELDVVLNESFADTQSRDYLIKRVAERGIIPDKATKAILKGAFNIDVPLGSRFSISGLNYAVTEKIGSGIYKLTCETAGAIGNQNLGDLMPIDYIEGLTRAELREVLIPGEDEETTEHLRQRYFDSLQSQSFGGNVADYKDKTLAIPGVGGVKVYPAWEGGGTVKLMILDATYEAPSQMLIETVQTAVDPVSNQGEGKGFAPIGHVVTVSGVTSEPINIQTAITYEEGWNWESVKPYVEAAIDDYFSELAMTWDSTSQLVVRISQIETRLLGIEGILDITGTTLNQSDANWTLDKDSIPERGDLIG